MPDLVLYDGVCGLCNRLTQFILKRDRGDRFRFASLQGSLAREILGSYRRNADDLDTMYVVADHDGPSQRLLSRSEAVIHVLRALGVGWKMAGAALSLLPRSAADRVYAFVAARRYRWFGRHDSCPLPSPHDRAKFLDQAAG